MRQLQLVFFISTGLLLVSFTASFYSIQKLISNSRLVNHTNQVLLEAENIVSYTKDAETGQRGYLISQDPLFLQPYTGSYGKVKASFNRLQQLTIDNPAQQKNVTQAQALYEAKFSQMQRVMDQVGNSQDTIRQHQELTKGKTDNG